MNWEPDETLENSFTKNSENSLVQGRDCFESSTRDRLQERAVEQSPGTPHEYWTVGKSKTMKAVIQIIQIIQIRKSVEKAFGTTHARHNGQLNSVSLNGTSLNSSNSSLAVSIAAAG